MALRLGDFSVLLFLFCSFFPFFFAHPRVDQFATSTACVGIQDCCKKAELCLHYITSFGIPGIQAECPLYPDCPPSYYRFNTNGTNTCIARIDPTNTVLPYSSLDDCLGRGDSSKYMATDFCLLPYYESLRICMLANP